MRWFYVLVPLVLLASCGGGTASAPVAPGAPAPVATASIAYISSYSGSEQPNIVSAPLVLYDQQFLDFGEAGYLLALQATPPLPQGTAVTWSSSNSSAIPVETQMPFTVGTPGDPAPTAPPNEIYVQTGTSYGTSVISATAANGVSASLTAYRYPSLSFGCRFRSIRV